MIKTFFCSYEEEIYLEVNKYINQNLKELVGSYIDFATDDEQLFNIFPTYKYEENSQFGMKTIKELYNLICSRIEREDIKPKYEYALFVIINYWIDIEDDDCPFDFIEIDAELRRKIELYDENQGEECTLIKSIQNLESYEESCFWDWDFLPQFIDENANNYIKNLENEKYKEEFYWLDEYASLMAPDLKERYLEIRAMGKPIDNGNGVTIGNIYVNNGKANVIGENTTLNDCSMKSED
ncbi:hypothetical protein [Clostridium butyricum]|uniref:hypothetical protein n=1 Tax=Clostridium butyricum TaxID=1492 RepID=UPI0032C14CAA